MKARTRKGRTGRVTGINTKRMPRALNVRPQPYLKLLEDEQELLTDADMMRIFRVDRVTLYRWRKNKVLPYSKLSRNVYYVKVVICNILLTKSGVLK